ncbi:MAG: DNA repair exonuclease [Pseudomonadales bacterium]|nr:DNA repair exonuclease [Pseudomonadales bacterium]
MLKANCKIFHTSDIHLDDDIGPAGEESVAQLGFIAVIDAAIKLEVDLFLLAGDLFEHNRIKQTCQLFATAQLARLPCPVVMIAGNHDCLADYSVYVHYDPAELNDNVHFIKDESGATVEFERLGLRLWGRSIVDHGPENRPLENLPTLDNNYWNVGMAHGYYINRGGSSLSSLISPEEIASSQFDYLALGHVHAFSTFQHGITLAAYPGSPNARLVADEITAACITFDTEAGININRVLL